MSQQYHSDRELANAVIRAINSDETDTLNSGIASRANVGLLTGVGVEQVGKQLFVEGVAVGNKIGSSRLKVAAIGDSITFQNLVENNGISSQPAASGYLIAAQMLYPSMEIVSILGYPGKKAIDLVVGLPAIIASKPDVCCVECGANSFAPGQTTNTGLSVYNEIVTLLLNPLLDVGIVPIVFSIPVRQLLATDTIFTLVSGVSIAANNTQIAKANSLLSKWCTDNNAYYCDMYNALIDPVTQLNKPERVADATTLRLHPNTNGGAFIGKLLSDILKLIKPKNVLKIRTNQDSSIVTPNPQLIGSNASPLNGGWTMNGTLVSGTGPDCCRVNASNTTTVVCTGDKGLSGAGNYSQSVGGLQLAITFASAGDRVTLALGNEAYSGYLSLEAVRANSKLYQLGYVIQVSGVLYKVGKGGTSAASAPVFTTIAGDSIVDGTVVWLCLGNGIKEGDQFEMVTDLYITSQDAGLGIGFGASCGIYGTAGGATFSTATHFNAAHSIGVAANNVENILTGGAGYQNVAMAPYLNTTDKLYQNYPKNELLQIRSPILTVHDGGVAIQNIVTRFDITGDAALSCALVIQQCYLRKLN